MQPLKEQITALLEALELNFEFDEENNLFRLNFEECTGSCLYLI